VDCSRLFLLGKQNVYGGVGERVELDVKPLGLPALAGEGRRYGLKGLVIWREEELVEHLPLPVGPGPVAEVCRLLAGDVEAPAGGGRLHQVPRGRGQQVGLLRHQPGLVLVVVQTDLVTRKDHKAFSHVPRGLVMCAQTCVLRTLGQNNLQILCFGLDEVHEVVEVGGGGLGAVGEVCLLHGHQEGRRQQPVTKHKLARGDVHLDDRDEVPPVRAKTCPSPLILRLLLLLLLLARQ